MRMSIAHGLIMCIMVVAAIGVAGPAAEAPEREPGMVPPSIPALTSVPEDVGGPGGPVGRTVVSGDEWHRVVYTTPAVDSWTGGPRKVDLQTDLVVVLVEEGLLTPLNASVSLYVDDLEVCGYRVKLVEGAWTDPASVRSLLRDELASGLVGAVLVGDIVSAWFEILDGDASWGIQEFPTDLYYTDLDGSWGDFDMDGMFDIHNGSVRPEIWVGRLKPSVIGDEVDLLRNYFRKNHDYRTGNLSLPHRSLVYVDEDWTYWSYGWKDSVAKVYPNSTLINDAEGDATNRNDYLYQLRQGYEWIHVGVHSYSTSHWFMVDGQWRSDQLVYSAEVGALDPKTHFWNLWACSNARFTTPGCMGSQYIFADTYGLLTVGSTKTGGMIEPDDFYTPLSENITIGEAFQEWFIKVAERNRNWTYGMVVLGDPTLGTHRDIHAISPDVTSPTHPDPEEVYSADTVLFEWETPRDLSGIEGYYIAFDHDPDTVPDPARAQWTTSNNVTYRWLQEGYYYFHIVSVDGEGNVAKVPTHYMIAIDRTPPTASIVIDDDGRYSTDLTVNLTIGAEDNTGIRSMRFSWDNETWTGWVDFNRSHSVQLPPGDGTKTLYLQVLDRSGLVSVDRVSDSIVLDTTAPVGSVAVDTVRGYSPSTEVMVWITGEDANGVMFMRLSDDGEVWSAWRPFSTSTRWTLPEGDGTKQVHLQLMDDAGLISTDLTFTSLILDTTPPEVTVTIDGGALYTITSSVDIGLTVTDAGPVDVMRYAFSGETWGEWTALETLIPMDLPGTDGRKVFQVEVRDRAGNVCILPGTAAITLDTTPPTGNVTLDAGVVYTTDQEVEVNITATDENGVGLMSIRWDGGAWSDWGKLVGSFDVVLSDGDGPKTIEVRLKDAAGLVSTDPMSCTIVFDTTPPTGTMAIAGPDPYYTNTNPVTLTITDEPSGDAVEMRIKVLGGDWSDWVPFSPSWDVQLEDFEGLQTVYILLRDGAGLETPTPVSLDLFLDTREPLVSIEGWPPEWSTDEADPTYLVHVYSEEGGSPVVLLGVSYDKGGTWHDIPLEEVLDLQLDLHLDWSQLREGRQEMHFHVVDMAGNEGRMYTHFQRDSEGPDLKMSRVGYRAGMSDIHYRWTVFDNASGLTSLLLYVDDGDPVNVTERTSHWIEGLTNGEHTVRLVATDEAGNEAEVSTTFQVDGGILNNSWSWMLVTLLVMVLVAAASLFTMWSRRRDVGGG